MDMSSVSVCDDGSVSGVREALQELLKKKPYLSAAPSRSTGSSGNFPRPGSDASSYAARLSLARNSGNNTLAAAIISEAADKGVFLR